MLHQTRDSPFLMVELLSTLCNMLYMVVYHRKKLKAVRLLSQLLVVFYQNQEICFSREMQLTSLVLLVGFMQTSSLRLIMLTSMLLRSSNLVLPTLVRSPLLIQQTTQSNLTTLLHQLLLPQLSSLRTLLDMHLSLETGRSSTMRSINSTVRAINSSSRSFLLTVR